MRFFVTDHNFKPLTVHAFEEPQAAGEEAFDLVFNLRASNTAIVVAMESETYRTDVPAHMLVRVTAMSELERF